VCFSTLKIQTGLSVSQDKTNAKVNANPSRRNLLVGSAAIVASAGAAAATRTGNAAATAHDNKAMHRTNMVTTKDGAQIYFNDWGTGPNTVVFSHGWPLSADAWEEQMMFLAANGYRCIAHDRRDHGHGCCSPGTTTITTHLPAIWTPWCPH
jgi:non-heme chloroperoxidase